MQKRGWLLPLVLTVFFLVMIIGTAFASLLATESSAEPAPAPGQETTYQSPYDLTGLKEEIDKRQINSKTYLNPATGVHSAIIDLKPIHYKDNNGKWQDIVLDLKDSSDPQYNKEYSQGNISIKLSEKSRPQDMVSIKNKDKELTFAPIDDSSVDITLPRNVNKDLQTPNGAFGTRAANYGNVYQDIDFRYELGQDALKEIIYINKPTTKNVFKFLIKENGLDFTANNDGTISVKDNQTDELLYQIQKSFATDSSNKPEVYKDLTTSIEKQGSHYILTLTLDPSWLSDPQRVYPIIIDPTIIYFQEGFLGVVHSENHGSINLSKAAKVYEGAATTNYETDNLSVGENDAGNRWRTYVQIKPTGTLPAGATIINATQSLYMYGQNNGTGVYLTAYKVTSNWYEYGVTWNNQPSYAGDSIPTAWTSNTFGWKNFNITNTFIDWNNAPSTNYGLMIWVNDSNYYDYKQFYGNEYVNGGNPSMYRPQLKVEYTEPPAASIVTPTGDQWTTDSTPTFDWNFSDPDGDAQNKYRVQVSPNSNFSPLTIDTGNVTSSATAYTPSTSLADGTYYWRVTVYDSYDWSGWTSSASNNGKFKVDATAPTGTLKVNNDESYTNRQDVIMSSSASDNFSGIYQMRFSDTTSFTSSSWSTYATTTSYNLPTGDGSKTVYAQFKDVVGNVSSTVNDSISLETGKQTGEKGFWSYKDVAGLKVNLQTGNLIHGGTDVAIPGRGPNLSLSRTYNSLSDSSDSTYGQKWSVSPSMRIIETSGYTKLIEGDGSEYVYIPNPDNTYKSPPGDFRKLVKNGSGNFTLTTKDQTKFNIVSNRLSTIVDSNSNTMTISYDGSNKITNLTDASGRGLTLAYDANGRLKNTIDPANRITTCSYDGSGRLTSVINPNNETVSYSYNAQNQLTDVTNPMGATIHITYTNNKVTQISVPTNPVANTDFSYNANNQVNVTDPNRNVYTYSLNDTGQTISVIEPMGASPDPTTPEADFPDDETVAYSAVVDYTNYWNTLTDAVEKSINQYTPPSGGQTITNNYDSNFNLIKEIQKDGSSTSFSYDVNGNNLTVRDRVGFTTSYTYDSNNNLLTSTTPAGDTSTNSYDQATGNLLSSTDEEGNKTTYDYDSYGNKKWIVSPKGNIVGADPDKYKTTLSYDNSGNYLVKSESPAIDNPDGTRVVESTAYSYDNIGNKTSETDSSGNVTYYTYDNIGRSIITRSPVIINGLSTISYVKSVNTYDANGNVIKEESIDENTSQAKSRKEYEFNSASQKIKEKVWNDVNDSSSISETSYTYDANANVLTETNPLNGVTNYQYDSINRVTKETKPDSSFKSYKYDASGNIFKEGSAFGTTASIFAKNGKQIVGTDELTNTVKNIYDENGNQVKSADPEDDAITLNFDEGNKLENITDLNGMRTAFKYDPNQNENSVTFNDQSQNKTQLSSSYNQQDELNVEEDQLNKEVKTSYNTENKLSNILPPNGKKINFTYTRGLSLKSIQSAGVMTNSTNTSFKYDATGNQSQAIVTSAFSSQTVASTSVEYDSASRITKLTDLLGVMMSFLYDKANNLTKITDSITGDSASINYTFNTSSKLTDIDYKNINIDFIYENGNLSTINLQNGVSTTIGYNKAQQVKSFINKKGSTTISSYDYFRDAKGNITSITDLSGTFTYLYDDLSRLTNVINTDNSRVTYSYDNLGNRLSRKDSTGTASYTYNAINELTLLTKPNGQTVSYSYDDNGNLLTEYASASGTTSYSYDSTDNLVKAVKPNGDTIEFVYDGKGRRYSKAVTPSGSAAVSTFYQYDNQGNIVLETDANKNIIVKYIRDNSGKALAMEQNNQMYYFVYNGHGDVISVTDSSGNTVATYSYDEFGNLKSSTGSIYNPLRYAAMHNSYFDSELNLYKMGVRYYKADIGRWTTRDKAPANQLEPETYHRYVYAKNNPINFVDPTGLTYIIYDGRQSMLYHTSGKSWMKGGLTLTGSPKLGWKVKAENGSAGGPIPYGNWVAYSARYNHSGLYQDKNYTDEAYGTYRLGELWYKGNGDWDGANDRDGLFIHGGPMRHSSGTLRHTNGCIRVNSSFLWRLYDRFNNDLEVKGSLWVYVRYGIDGSVGSVSGNGNRYLGGYRYSKEGDKYYNPLVASH